MSAAALDRMNQRSISPISPISSKPQLVPSSVKVSDLRRLSTISLSPARSLSRSFSLSRSSSSDNVNGDATTLTKSHDFLSRALGSEIALLSTESALKQYSENAKKLKDPEVLLSYSQILIRAALEISDKEVKGKGKTTLTSQEQQQRKKYLLEAHEALKKCCKAGLLDAQYLLGDCYYNGVFSENGKPEHSKALQLFEMAGKLKHAEAAYRTALCYRRGIGCNPDSRKVVKFVEIAALNGLPVAMMDLEELPNVLFLCLVVRLMNWH
ncbi:unnamed protein product [Ambrosiozyma monospora]|uniref:Unnamed protein product n=1 Tax=Ambrosiozyma monospora TaxID=43982 RepID=A0ACB5UCC2_AMBMO|nr:unnamed protein product [Ambrosiozyma monospora]